MVFLIKVTVIRQSELNHGFVELSDFNMCISRTDAFPKDYLSPGGHFRYLETQYLETQ